MLRLLSVASGIENASKHRLLDSRRHGQQLRCWKTILVFLTLEEESIDSAPRYIKVKTLPDKSKPGFGLLLYCRPSGFCLAYSTELAAAREEG
jgi:hypothetical protein